MSVLGLRARTINKDRLPSLDIWLYPSEYAGCVYWGYMVTSFRAHRSVYWRHLGLSLWAWAASEGRSPSPTIYPVFSSMPERVLEIFRALVFRSPWSENAEYLTLTYASAYVFLFFGLLWAWGRALLGAGRHVVGWISPLSRCASVE
jgi:hypothetical protein